MADDDYPKNPYSENSTPENSYSKYSKNPDPKRPLYDKGQMYPKEQEQSYAKEQARSHADKTYIEARFLQVKDEREQTRLAKLEDFLACIWCGEVIPSEEELEAHEQAHFEEED